MRRFVEGADRGQSTLLLECLDDWIDENNPVRVIDAFVDALDLGGSVPSSPRHSARAGERHKRRIRRAKYRRGLTRASASANFADNIARRF
jgi:transposase